MVNVKLMRVLNIKPHLSLENTSEVGRCHILNHRSTGTNHGHMKQSRLEFPGWTSNSAQTPPWTRFIAALARPINLHFISDRKTSICYNSQSSWSIKTYFQGQNRFLSFLRWVSLRPCLLNHAQATPFFSRCNLVFVLPDNFGYLGAIVGSLASKTANFTVTLFWQSRPRFFICLTNGKLEFGKAFIENWINGFRLHKISNFDYVGKR